MRLQLEIKLDWSEMDLFGHINNVAYFKYAQAARVNYLEAAGINTADPTNKNSFVVAASSCEFKQPLYFPSSIQIITFTEWTRNSSLQLVHEIYNQKNELAARATDVIVLYDYSTKQKLNITEELKKILA